MLMSTCASNSNFMPEELIVEPVSFTSQPYFLHFRWEVSVMFLAGDMHGSYMLDYIGIITLRQANCAS